MEAKRPLKRRSISTRLHGTASQTDKCFKSYILYRILNKDGIFSFVILTNSQLILYHWEQCAVKQKQTERLAGVALCPRSTSDRSSPLTDYVQMALCHSQLLCSSGSCALLFSCSSINLEHGDLTFRAEDGGIMFLRNAGIYLQVHTTLQPRRPTRYLRNFRHVSLVLVNYFTKCYLLLCNCVTGFSWLIIGSNGGLFADTVMSLRVP
jgi:hypothetical protein